MDEPFCAMNADRSRVLMISDDMIRFEVPVDEEELESVLACYEPTSRYIEYDLEKLERLIEAYLQEEAYVFTADFNEPLKQISLGHKNPPNFDNYHEYIDAKHPNIAARRIVREVFQQMKHIFPVVFEPL
jgi:hypothetical protein